MDFIASDMINISLYLPYDAHGFLWIVTRRNILAKPAYMLGQHLLFSIMG